MPSIAQLEKLLTLDERDSFVLYALAQEHAKLGGPTGHAKAIEFYDRCLAADPAYCYAYFHKAKSLEALGRSAEAAGTLRLGVHAARNAGDAKAHSEIAAFLNAIE
jgi:tetratricopeptide (TPR) repeat protein